jgi:hypothetical protein
MPVHQWVRREVLTTRREPPVNVSFIIEQAVLERWTGGEDLQRELLDHQLDVTARHWNVELQVMPLRAPVHAGLHGPLRLLEMPERWWFAYSEGRRMGGSSLT